MIHIVDPNIAVEDALMELFKAHDLEARVFKKAESYLQYLGKSNKTPRCLLVESHLPGINGLSLLARLRNQGFSAPIIIMMSIKDQKIRQKALQLGATEVLEKPLINGLLMERIEPLLIGGKSNLVENHSHIVLENGVQITVRPMQPSDTKIEQAFVQSLSARSSYLRFFSILKQLSPDMLEKFTTSVFPQNYALIATTVIEKYECQVGVARYAATDKTGVAEFAVVVADHWQGLGIASYLLAGVVTAAAVAGLTRLEGIVMKENQAMLCLAKKHGFSLSDYTKDPSLVNVFKQLKTAKDFTNDHL